MEYDWEHRVDTTAATVSARDRFIGLLNSPYQATDPELFKEMMAELPVRFEEFTFIDVGSGKGRTLLIAVIPFDESSESNYYRPCIA
jgi:ABC-type thiamine transport system ATPase subunit